MRLLTRQDIIQILFEKEERGFELRHARSEEAVTHVAKHGTLLLQRLGVPCPVNLWKGNGQGVHANGRENV